MDKLVVAVVGMRCPSCLVLRRVSVHLRFMKNISVAILGHSYVRDLKALNHSTIAVTENLQITLSYHFRCGGTFEAFLNNSDFLDSVSLHPDIVLVYLGGNDVRIQTPLSVVYANCKRFYLTVKDRLPRALIVASQIESRYCTSVNRFGTPAAEEYSKLANYFDKWINRQSQFKDKLFMVKGANKLSNPEYYARDRIHLNASGIRRLFQLLKDFLCQLCLEKFK